MDDGKRQDVGEESGEVGKAPVERSTSSSIDSMMSGLVSIYGPPSAFTFPRAREPRYRK